jgi:hypothetical protein
MGLGQTRAPLQCVFWQYTSWLVEQYTIPCATLAQVIHDQPDHVITASTHKGVLSMLTQPSATMLHYRIQDRQNELRRVADQARLLKAAGHTTNLVEQFFHRWRQLQSLWGGAQASRLPTPTFSTN